MPPASPSNWPVNILAATVFLIPAVGVPNEYILQDTLKSAIAAFGILLAAWVFFWQPRGRTITLRWHAILWLPLSLIVYALCSMAWSHAYLAAVEAIRWALVTLMLWLLVNTMDGKSPARLLWGVHGGAFVASIWVALQFWFDLQLFPQAAPPASTFANRNFFAEYAVSVLPLSVVLLLTQRYARWLLLLTGTVALDVVAILMTGTRSALLALAIIAPWMLFAAVRYRHVLAWDTWTTPQRVTVAAFFLAAITLLGSIPSGNINIGQGRTPFAVGSTRSVSMTGVLQGQDTSFSVRLEMWKATARMFMAQPWTGVGAGAWEVHIPLYQRSDSSLELDYYAHNDHLQMLGEYGGLVGGLALAILIAHALLSAASIARKTPRPASADEALCAMAAISLIALLLVANAGFPLHLASGGVLLALTLACTAHKATENVNNGLHQIAWRPAYRRSALAVLSIGLVLATVATQRAMVGEYKLVRAMATYADIRRAAKSSVGDVEGLRHAMVEDIHQAIATVPHYRKLITETGDLLVALGDWDNVVPVWEVVAKSRPNIPAVWTILALAYARTHQPALANDALAQVQRLRPHAISTTTLAIQLKKEAGDLSAARQMLADQLRTGAISYDLLQLAYVVGYETGDLSMAIQAMELRNTWWPTDAADTHMRLGNLYADQRVGDNKKALAQFALGLQSVPVDERPAYLAQIPERFRLLRDHRGDERSGGALGAGNDTRRGSTGH